MHPLLCLIAVGLMCAAASGAPKADIYVAVNGSDRWSGRLPSPNRSRTDGPLATLGAAQQAVRRIRATEATPRTVTVMVRKGVYELAEPIVIRPEESGAEGRPTIYGAYPGERPVISGGKRLTGWVNDRGKFRVEVPEVRDGGWRFEQLFVNGQRRYRPRLPKHSYYYIEDEASPSPDAGQKGFDRFVFREGDIRSDWTNRDDVNVLCFQSWTMARMRIADVSPTDRAVRFVAPTISTMSFFALPKGGRYIVENVREALTEPGEWYLDTRTGVLEYLPRRGETPGSLDVRAPRLDTLVEFRGDVERRRWVKHVELRGLTFAHANWVCPREGSQAPQAEVHLSGAIRARGASDCRLDACTVKHVGAYAIEFGEACKRASIENCTIVDLGAGGIKLGETSGRDDPELLSGWHTVRNNLIAHGGRMHPAGIGVWIGASPHNLVAHNEICDLYYSAVSVGWSWGYAPSAAHHNTLEYNYAHHIGQGVLSDMGATYTLGSGGGSVQRYNHFHDVESYGYGGWGIYFDEGTTGMLAENNLVYRCKSAGFHQHYGRDNIVRNNVFALNREAQVMRTRAEEHLSFIFERNIVYWDTGQLLASNWSGGQYRLDHNIYWRTGGRPFDLAGRTWDQWREAGNDRNSVMADPLFVAPDRNDFRLKAGSPAFAVGFVPFDISPAGRVGRGSRKPEPVYADRGYPAPPVPKPARVQTGFEDEAVGERAANATTIEENEEATARVTDETAASGKHSLKIVDRPGQKAEYNPHVWWTPNLGQDIVVATFAMRLEAGTSMYHEWRGPAGPAFAGPSLHVDRDGALTVRGKKLLDLPHGQWIRFEIRCRVGERATGSFDLTIRLPGRTAPLRYHDLPCDPGFSLLTWFGFVANSADAGEFYLDDIDVKSVAAK